MLDIRGLTKSFGGTAVLRGVDLRVRAGEIHAVLGENGAGKSTLMRILAGLYPYDGGTCRIGNEEYRPQSPEQARRNGVALVPQEPELAGHLTVAENILLGAEPSRWGWVDRRALDRIAGDALGQVGDQAVAVRLDQRAGELSTSDRQRVVIARALAQANPRVLTLDEPTSSLTTRDVDRLFAVLGNLRQRNLAIVYISHFLEEVQRICDRYTVLRDGRTVGTGNVNGTSSSSLVTLMAGESVGERPQRAPRETGNLVLSVDALAGRRLPVSATLELHRGEVLGIAGLVGAGRSELLRCLFGLEAVLRGTVRVGAFVGAASPATRLSHGVGLLSEDRKGEGLAGSLGIAQNITLSKLIRRGPWLLLQRERDTAQRWVDELGIRCQSVEQPVMQLSGGNQQKVALARLLHHDIDVLLLDEPTRGIDVRSRLDVHRAIDELVNRGKSVILVSSYLPELLAVADRIAVMRRGILGPAEPTSAWSEHRLLLEASGG